MKFGCSNCFFLSTTNLICRSTDISKCFRGSFRFRDNESRLYKVNVQHTGILKTGAYGSSVAANMHTFKYKRVYGVNLNLESQTGTYACFILFFYFLFFCLFCFVFLLAWGRGLRRVEGAGVALSTATMTIRSSCTDPLDDKR